MKKFWILFKSLWNIDVKPIERKLFEFYISDYVMVVSYNYRGDIIGFWFNSLWNDDVI